MAKWNEFAFGEAPGHHLPGCTGHCKGVCSADMARAWARLPPLAVSNEAVDPDRIPTAAEGVPITMGQLMGVE